MINLRKLAYQYTDEQAQNAVGIILTDSPSINFYMTQKTHLFLAQFYLMVLIIIKH